MKDINIHLSRESKGFVYTLDIFASKKPISIIEKVLPTRSIKNRISPIESSLIRA